MLEKARSGWSNFPAASGHQKIAPTVPAARATACSKYSIRSHASTLRSKQQTMAHNRPVSTRVPSSDTLPSMSACCERISKQREQRGVPRASAHESKRRHARRRPHLRGNAARIREQTAPGRRVRTAEGGMRMSE